ncbi:hypothetical protein [Lacinutrix sp. Bg11-31]|uniref:hypothetical protein n=1 Tax=Lacinutrix sp. Bg11-31 TaxID=2057808 RepID=UPI000C3083EB|nr:hypothetical protein [Lacinutrix sp. Bg11-31]AUC83476.1 hypothetical protein CW733_15585 [Lacinutrix sp. Bg11-31]
MKIILVTLSLFSALFFSETKNISEENQPKVEAISKATIGSSFKLINDTKEKVSIYTGTGFVSLNKGSSTSIGCNTGKEVRWASKGKKGDVIFKIESKHCGKTIKLSKVM